MGNTFDICNSAPSQLADPTVLGSFIAVVVCASPAIIGLGLLAIMTVLCAKQNEVEYDD